MSIEYVKGDLFTTEDKIIVHGCNAQGVMRSGVAKIVREQFPAAYHTYMKIYHEHGLELGTTNCAQTKGKIIVNAITQEYYGRDGRRYVDYEAVESCMKKIDTLCMMLHIYDISMPKIGAGLGGGDWDTIERIIDKELKYVRVKVYEL